MAKKRSTRPLDRLLPRKEPPTTWFHPLNEKLDRIIAILERAFPATRIVKGRFPKTWGRMRLLKRMAEKRRKKW